MVEATQGGTEPKTKMDRLSSVIITSIFRGGLYGALFSIPTDLLLTWRSPMYRWLGLRGRIFYHTICVAAGANFVTEKQILKFEATTRYEKDLRRKQLIEASIANGDFGAYDDDVPVIKHHGGKKARSDVAAARLNRDEIVTKGGGSAAGK